MRRLEFTNPNTLEAGLAAEATQFHLTRPRLVCHGTSVAVSIPANVVQNTFPNRSAPRSTLSAMALAQAFATGERLDVERYQGLVANACHQELELHLLEPAPRPTVSVVVPCYEQAEFLSDAVASVVAQAFTDWELVVVDDGSPDDTVAVTERLKAAHSSRAIRLLRRPNGGVSAARNAGIAVSTGEYVLPLDADDTIAPEMLASTVAALDANPSVAIAYTDFERFGLEQGRFRAPDFDPQLVPSTNQFSYCALYRRDAWLQVGGYNPNMSAGYEDWDFWIGCVEAGFSATRVPVNGFRYRVRAASRNLNAIGRDGELRRRIRRNHPSAYRLPRRLGRGLHRVDRSLRLRFGDQVAG
jgi:glycosyltransferase involved in cell wall biosynthesis